MRAFHNDPKIKETYLNRVRAHRMADELIKGKYWENGKGCAVGCTIHSGDHSSYETELGIPRVLARLEDGIFERLPNDIAMTWPERFLDAITPGADLTKVWNKFAYWLLVDPVNGVLRFADTALKIKAINDVAAIYLRSLKEDVAPQEWCDAYAAADVAADAYVAYAAAAYVADAAAAYVADAAADVADAAADVAYAAAAYVAYAAADAAAYVAYAAAAYAAYAAAAYAAADAAAYAAYAADAAAAAAAADAAAAAYAADARTKARIIQSERLLELLREAK